MLEASRERILRELPGEAVVLDVGGWAKPWHRADWVIDLMPYETRGLYGGDDQPASGRALRRVDSWVVRDICDREPWPFADDQFDFVVCSHTLEDVRDPVWVCERDAARGTLRLRRGALAAGGADLRDRGAVGRLVGTTTG